MTLKALKVIAQKLKKHFKRLIWSNDQKNCWRKCKSSFKKMTKWNNKGYLKCFLIFIHHCHDTKQGLCKTILIFLPVFFFFNFLRYFLTFKILITKKNCLLRKKTWIMHFHSTKYFIFFVMFLLFATFLH